MGLNESTFFCSIVVNPIAAICSFNRSFLYSADSPSYLYKHHINDAVMQKANTDLFRFMNLKTMFTIFALFFYFLASIKPTIYAPKELVHIFCTIIPWQKVVYFL